MLDIETFSPKQSPMELPKTNVIKNFLNNCKNKLNKIRSKPLDKKFDLVNRLSSDFNKVASISQCVPEIYFIEVFEDNSIKVVFNCQTQYLPVFKIKGE